jgi:hypothetical protein
MKRCFLLMALMGALFAQSSQRGPELPPPPGRPDNTRLPSGKLQRDEMLKSDQEHNRVDAAELVRLAAEVQDDIEKNDRYVVSVKTLKKLDEIAKLTRNIHGRLNRY